MLRIPINKNEDEYEIQNSKVRSELDFYNYFIDIMNKTKFDIVEHQIIVNYYNHNVEIRIKMNKLNRCFSSIYDLDVIENDPRMVCRLVIEIIENYARKLCYKD